MDIAFVAKIICDLSLWFGLGGFILSFFGEPGAAAVPMTAIVLSCALCNALKNRKLWLRLLPLLLLVPVCIFSVRDIMSAVFLLPPVAYGVWLCAARRFSLDYAASTGYFKTTAIALLIFFPVAAMFGGTGLLEAYIFPYFIIFLFSGVLMLRLLRHDEHMKMTRRLLFINLALLGGCCAAVVLLNSDLFYHAVLLPLGQALGYLLDLLVWLISQFIRLFLPDDGRQSSSEALRKEFDPAVSNGQADPSQALLILAVAVFLIFAAVLLRRLWANRSKTTKNVRINETRTRIPDNPAPRQRPSLLRPHDPREAVRWYYRLFLLKARNNKAVFRPCHTSEMILQLVDGVFDPLLLSELRDIYLTARYSPAAVTREDIRRARSIYIALKKPPGKP